jgi:exopolysaccharide biosynthesis polyprenyl glycosylphosphotransferase
MKTRIFNLSVALIYPAVDFIVITFTIMCSYKFYRILKIGQYVYYQKTEIIPYSFLAGLITVIVMHLFGVYRKTSSILNVEEIKNAILSISLGFLLLMFIMVFWQINLSRYVLIFSYSFSLIFVVIEKTFFYHFIPLAKNIKGLNRKVIIYGAGELGKALYREIANSPKLGLTPVGFIDDDPSKHHLICYQSGFDSSKGVPVLGGGDDIKKLRNTIGFDEVYVAISDIDSKRLTSMLGKLKEENLKVSFVPNLYNFFIRNIKLQQIGQIPLIQEGGEPSPKLYLYVKRYIDLFLGVICFGLLWPLFVVIALGIKIDSKGPVFFKHKRVGLNGEVFEMYKFRTMFADVNPYAINPLHVDDPRITKFGRYLRKSSLDELPQIINVLVGDMSFVGPRPEMPFIVAEYNEFHKERLKVKPGITGLWQLSGDRKKAIHENMDYDLYYIGNVSFFLDLAILLETLIFAFRGI